MIHHVDTDEEIVIEAAEVAPMLLAWLELNGAVVGLGTADQLRVNLDPLPDMNDAKADRISRLIFSVRDELRALLLARHGGTVH